MSEELKTAIDAAKKGAEKALSYYNTPLTVTFKNDSSPVTKADKETEHIIKESIQRVFPHANFLAEESGGDKTQESFWIIDPIDGTRCFSRGLPHWCILIALYKKGEIVLGVSYFPVLDKLFYAEKGKGTYCNDDQIHVSNISSLKNALVAYGSPKHFKHKQVILDLIDESSAARCMDDSIQYVISGKIDALVDGYAQTWDAAPYITIIEDAGGKITNLKGEKWTLSDRGFIASNGLVHDEVVKIVNK